MRAAATTTRISLLAIASAVAGGVSVVSAYTFPVALGWISKTAMPGPDLVASALPLLPPVVAIACGHAALVATRRVILTGRRAAWTGLILGYVGVAQVIAFEGFYWFLIWLRPIQY